MKNFCEGQLGNLPCKPKPKPTSKPKSKPKNTTVIELDPTLAKAYIGRGIKQKT